MVGLGFAAFLDIAFDCYKILEPAFTFETRLPLRRLLDDEAEPSDPLP